MKAFELIMAFILNRYTLVEGAIWIDSIKI